MNLAPVLASLAVAIPAAPSAPRPDPAAMMAGCQGVDACLHRLDPLVPPTDTGVFVLDLPNRNAAAEVATNLGRFGPAAKLELLRRATGRHGGWRNVASEILASWPDLSAEDVPQLAQALRIAPGGWIAGALARIGTPEAIQALADDLHNNSAFGGSQTTWALAHLGAKAAPYLLAALDDPAAREGVIQVLRDMPPASAGGLAPALIDRALDPARPEPLRLAALRALEVIESSTQLDAARLRPLVLQSPADLREQAISTLAASRDPSVLTRLVARCRPTLAKRTYTQMKVWPSVCLPQVLAYGAAVAPVAEPLLDFLDAPLGEDRAAGAAALGLIGYRRATPVLIDRLSDPDWRVVFASARSLGWLGATEAVPALKSIADSHWLPEDRAEALAALAEISNPRGAPSPAGEQAFRELLQIPPMEEAPACPSRLWRWKGIDIQPPNEIAHQATRSLELAGGRLQGTDFGEFGGSLAWVTSGGPARGEPLVEDNVHALAKTHGGAVAVFGLAHMSSNYGYISRLDPQPDFFPPWSVTEIGALPAAPQAMMQVDDDTFVVWSAGRAVVFTPQRILGIAACKG